MFNQVVLIGRLANDPVIREVSGGKNVCEVKLAVARPFKNQTNHIYDTDFIKVTFWEYLAINVNEYCNKGATVCVKGRLQVRNVSVGEKNIDVLEVVGEHIVFISRSQVKQEKDSDVIEDVPFDEIKEDL